MEKEEIITLIMNVIIVLITLYLIILYCISKTFHKYPCYNNIIISIVIFLDNALRLIKFSDTSPPSDYIHISQSFLLSLLDKLLLTTLTTNSFLAYLGVLKKNFYIKNERKIFYYSLCVSVAISFGISLYFICAMDDELTFHKYYYIKCDEELKIKIDTYFTLGLFSFNCFCILQLLLFLSDSIKEVSFTDLNNFNYEHHYVTVILMFFINEFLFLVVVLIIKNKMFVSQKYIDLVYISTCLGVDIFYTFNKTICKETLKLFCGKSEEMTHSDSFLSDEDKISRTSSLSN